MPTDINILELQQRILQGHTLTAEEYKQVIEAHRASRTAAATTAAAKIKKKTVDFDLNAEIDAALGL
jgi:hypothetical protein